MLKFWGSCKSVYLFLQKNGLGCNVGDWLTNSSGHPVPHLLQSCCEVFVWNFNFSCQAKSYCCKALTWHQRVLSEFLTSNVSNFSSVLGYKIVCLSWYLSKKSNTVCRQNILTSLIWSDAYVRYCLKIGEKIIRTTESRKIFEQTLLARPATVIKVVDFN
jgi:hypothetical protein